MAIFFKDQLIKEVGTVPITALVAGATAQLTVMGLSVTNLTEFPININVTITDDTSVEVYYLKEIPIPPNSSLHSVTSGEKLVLPANYSLKIWADESESADVVISYAEIL